MLDPLNLPSFEADIRCDKGGSHIIFDSLRGKFVALTPEEWVRQHFVNYLVKYLHFPSAFIANEVGLKLNNTRRRCDTLVYTRSLHPLCIVEYKRPSVEITEAVFSQIARYNSVLLAPFLIVTNGMRHYCCRFRGDSYIYLKSIPSYEEMNSVF